MNAAEFGGTHYVWMDGSMNVVQTRDDYTVFVGNSAENSGGTHFLHASGNKNSLFKYLRNTL